MAGATAPADGPSARADGRSHAGRSFLVERPPSVERPTPARAADAERWARLRPVPGVRAIRTTLRTAHLAAFAALYGGHWHGVAPERLVPALLATLATGGALAALESYRAPVWPFQLRGVATFVKIALVAAVALAWDARLWLLTATLVIGGVSSHMPGRFRYYSLAHGRVIGGGERG
jgi:hypothetical protein